MDINAMVHEHSLALSGAGRPPAPADPTNLAADDAVAFNEWIQSGPKKISCLGEDLQDSDFSSADLRLAGFKNCDLRGCNFRRADLRGADLRGCRLEGANFYGAEVDASTRIAGIDLGNGLANKSSLAVLLEALGGDPEEEQVKALLIAVQRAVG